MVKELLTKYREIQFFSNQKGMTLITTVIFVLVLVTFGVSFLSMTSNDIVLSALQRDSTQAFYLAEAGIQMAIREIKPLMEDPFVTNINSEWPTASLGKGTYTVAYHDPNYDSFIPEYHIRINSTGKVNRSERNLEVYVKEASTGGGMHPIFNYAIAAKGRIELQNKGPIYGDIYCEGTIKNGVPCWVYGNATATEGFEDFPEEYCSGEMYQGPEYTIPFPELTAEEMLAYKESAIASGTYYDSSYYKFESNVNLNGHVLYFTGDVEFIASTIIGPGIIAAEGRIKVSNNSKIGDSTPADAGDIYIVSSFAGCEKAIEISVSGPIYEDIYGVIFAPYAWVYLDTSGTIYGSVVGGGCGIAGERPAEIQATGGIVWQVSDNLAGYLPSDDVTIAFQIASWQEVN